MLKTLISFAGYLRTAGFSISTVEVEGCLQALTLVELNPINFKQVVQCSFVKSQQETAIFAKLFNAFFSVHGMPNHTEQTVEQQAFTCLEQRAAHTDGRGIGQSGAGGSSLCQALLNEDFRQISNLITSVLALLPSNIEQISNQDFSELKHQLQIGLDWAMTEHQLAVKFTHEPNKLNYYQNLLNKAEQELELYLIKYLAKKNGADSLQSYALSLNYKQAAFNKLSREQTEIVKKEVIKLGRKLAVRLSRRNKLSKRGRISMRHTVRRAYSTGGRVLKIIKRKKIPGKPEILLLCDLSNSVKQFSQFFLLLVHTMQKCFRSVHTMVFIDRLEDITQYIRQNNFPQVVEKALFNPRISASGFSDFGRIFSDINIYYSSFLKVKTTVIILGDARNNWRPPQVDALKNIAEKSAKIYWLNPRPRSTWYQEDSVLEFYQPYIRKTFECGNLEQLRVIARQIF